MKDVVGLWIDHREAVMVTVGDGKTAVTHIDSQVDKDHRLSGGSRSKTPYGPQDVASEQKFENRRMHQLDRFFEALEDRIRAAEQIFVMGPGEAKGEFVKHLRKTRELKDRIAGVETRDKMTENQIVADVKEFYGLARSVR
jgi:stalled ribosome rescue protein Dom34